MKRAAWIVLASALAAAGVPSAVLAGEERGVAQADPLPAEPQDGATAPPKAEEPSPDAAPSNPPSSPPPAVPSAPPPSAPSGGGGGMIPEFF